MLPLGQMLRKVLLVTQEGLHSIALRSRLGAV